MDVAAKLAILADAAKYDASCASSGAKRAGNGKGVGHSTGNGICHSYTPDGRCVSLLKILLTNVCIYDCIYCVNRVSSDIPRARFTVAEVVTMTLDFYRRNYIEGLFLSSGVMQTPDYTMEQLVEVARQLRETHHFGGYIHLKAMPDASPLLLAAAGRYADRVSVNIELPTPADLHRLAPDKSQTDDRRRDERICAPASTQRSRGKRERRKPPAFAPAGPVDADDRRRDRDHRQRDPADRVESVRAAAAAPGLLLGLQPDSRSPTRSCRPSRRRWCASIGCIRRIGCCASTAFASTS